MAQLKNNNNQPCWATFPCFYRKNNLCTFRAQADAMFDYLVERDPENSDCYRSMLDVISLPCSELSEEERQHGIENLLKLSE